MRLGSSLGTLVGPRATGTAGNLILETQRLIVQDGAIVSSATFGDQPGGSLLIRANEIDLIGKSADGLSPSRLSARSSGTGNAGDLRIETEHLTVQDGAQVTARSDRTGNAGVIYVNANAITLNNQGEIIASTTGGEGGNIELHVQDSLQIRSNSQISAEARGTGNGGNITIDTGTLAAFEESNITANAFGGRGGNIQINTQGLFLSPDSEIRASSEAGPQFNGVVQVNTPDIDFTRATVQPVGGPGSPEIASVCQGRSGTAINKLTNTGTGGVPANPTTPSSSTSGWQDGSPTQVANNSREAKRSTTDQPMQIVEAQGWKRNANGTVSMTANVLETVQHSSLTTLLCLTN